MLRIPGVQQQCFFSPQNRYRITLRAQGTKLGWTYCTVHLLLSTPLCRIYEEVAGEIFHETLLPHRGTRITREQNSFNSQQFVCLC